MVIHKPMGFDDAFRLTQLKTDAMDAMRASLEAFEPPMRLQMLMELFAETERAAKANGAPPSDTQRNVGRPSPHAPPADPPRASESVSDESIRAAVRRVMSTHAGWIRTAQIIELVKATHPEADPLTIGSAVFYFGKTAGLADMQKKGGKNRYRWKHPASGAKETAT